MSLEEVVDVQSAKRRARCVWQVPEMTRDGCVGERGRDGVFYYEAAFVLCIGRREGSERVLRNVTQLLLKKTKVIHFML